MNIIYRGYLDLRLWLLISFVSLILADPPYWEDNPGTYEFTAVMNAQVLIDAIPIADCVFVGNNNICDDVGGDMLAAFDSEGNIRGTGIPIMGLVNYQGQVIYETMLRSNSTGDVLTFKYYDASDDTILDIEESYEFVINAVIGNLMEPHTLSCDYMKINDYLLPSGNSLEQNYPNPYNPKTNIIYVIADLSNVILGVYDVKGQLITELISKIHTPGKYEFIWDADYLATGMYFLEMKVYSINGQLIFKDLNKMLYLK